MGTNSNANQPCEEATGVRRIWGTMRSCSSKTVLTVLQRLSTVADKVEVRQKFKKRNTTPCNGGFLFVDRSLYFFSVNLGIKTGSLGLYTLPLLF